MLTTTETKKNDPAVTAVAQGWARLNGDQRRAASLAMLSISTIELNDDPAPVGDSWKDMAEQIGPVEWAWEKWLPKGLLTILAGESGTGKSALALRICSTFLRGDPWPDGTPYNGEQGSVLWCEAEAAQAVNLGRAQAWGLPLEKIRTPLSDPLMDLQLDQPTHQAALVEKATLPEVKLIVIDSLRGMQQGEENSSGTMSLIKWIAEIARDTGKPVILTHHLRKRSLQDSDRVDLDRLRGSSAIVQTARVVWAVDLPDLDHKESKRFQVIKSNLATFPDPIGLKVDEDGVQFGSVIEAPQAETILARAMELIPSLLAQRPMKSTQVQEECEQVGIGWRTAKEAKKQLGIIAVRQGDAWFWSLPASEDD
jgi:putative DNA primase/helicase